MGGYTYLERKDSDHREENDVNCVVAEQYRVFQKCVRPTWHEQRFVTQNCDVRVQNIK